MAASNARSIYSLALPYILLLLLALSISGLRGDDGADYDQGVAKPCSMKFDNMDYSEVTSVCKAPDYLEKPCCDSFKKVACKYKGHVNDFSSTCPVEFMAYLTAAGNYSHDVFIDRCTTPSNLVCPK